MEKSNIFKSIPKHLDKEIFDLIVQKGDLKIERIVSQGHVTPDNEWYDQEKDEWVIVLEGAAEIVFEESDVIKLKRGDYVNIPAHTKHRVAWTAPDLETVWLAIHY